MNKDFIERNNTEDSQSFIDEQIDFIPVRQQISKWRQKVYNSDTTAFRVDTIVSSTCDDSIFNLAYHLKDEISSQLLLDRLIHLMTYGKTRIIIEQ
jgi:hypothetical protein